MKKTVFASCAFAASMVALVAAIGQPKPPFKIIFNNDTTNILSSPSPFNQDGRIFNTEKINASVDETADCGGVDVLMMASGMGWDPWWKSTALPMKKHVAWQRQRKGAKPSPYQQYILDGNDLVDTFVARAHQKGQTVFATFRMNDGHHYFGAARIADPELREKKMAVTQFFDEHPELRLGEEADPDSRSKYALDFAQPEVRAYRMQFIKELAQKSDLDGIELDFMRFWMLFHPFRTTSQERADIVTDFVKEVRAAFDRYAKPGQRRYLCVRIPATRDVMDKMGIDPVRLAKEAGVDMFNISGHYYTNMQNEAALIKKMLPENVAVYSELHFACAKQNYKVPLGVENGKGVIYDSDNVPANAKISWVFRRTPEQALKTAAYVVLSRGVDGLSFFNFEYYRSTRNPTDVFGDNFEPPYHLFKELRDPATLAREPQYYFLGHTHNEPYRDGRPFQNVFETGVPQTQWLDMVPPEGGWQKDGRLRIQSVGTLATSRWDVSINGVALTLNPDVSEPYKNPYGTTLGTPEQYRAWTVPAAILKDGLNAITVTLKSAPDGKGIPLFFLDIAMPANAPAP